MPRPAGWTATTPVDVTNLNANTKDVIGDLEQLNKIYFPNSDLVSAINAIPGMMNKAFYVDAINGDDINGDGSVDAPFKTIEKVINTVPAGSKIGISLRSDITLTQNINIGRSLFCVIFLNGYDILRPKTLLSSAFSLSENATLLLYGSGSITAEDTGSASWWQNSMFALYHRSTLILGQTVTAASGLTLNIGSPYWLASDGADASVQLNYTTLQLYGTQTASTYVLNRGGLITYFAVGVTIGTGITVPVRGLNT